MKQLYNFEAAKPPILNENMLKLEQARRAERRMAALFAVAAVMILVAAVWLAVSIAEYAPITAMVCIVYAIVSVIGGSAAAIVYAQKGGALT